MNTETKTQVPALMGLITETALHAGAGTSSGVIDLPIQREAHNDWPCVYGSAVKGALRVVGEQAWQGANDQLLFSVFGPNRELAHENAGSLSVGDARLVLLPVRSLTSAFRWVTCPDALHRLQRDAARLGLAEKFSFTIPDVADNTALTDSDAAPLFLEEYRLETQLNPAQEDMAAQLAQMTERPDLQTQLQQRLTLVSNDLFGYLVRNATQVNAHIALNSATKTVAKGALWYEETLPPETLLYVPLIAQSSRAKNTPRSADQTYADLKSLFDQKPWLQLGGNETVGMGWCGVTLMEG